MCRYSRVSVQSAIKKLSIQCSSCEQCEILTLVKNHIIAPNFFAKVQIILTRQVLNHISNKSSE